MGKYCITNMRSAIHAVLCSVWSHNANSCHRSTDLREVFCESICLVTPEIEEREEGRKGKRERVDSI